jgi:hypothetical protein
VRVECLGRGWIAIEVVSGSREAGQCGVGASERATGRNMTAHNFFGGLAADRVRRGRALVLCVSDSRPDRDQERIWKPCRRGSNERRFQQTGALEWSCRCGDERGGIVARRRRIVPINERRRSEAEGESGPARRLIGAFLQPNPADLHCGRGHHLHHHRLPSRPSSRPCRPTPTHSRLRLTSAAESGSWSTSRRLTASRRSAVPARATATLPDEVNVSDDAFTGGCVVNDCSRGGGPAAAKG